MRVREGRTRPSCMWCSPLKLTTAVLPAIMRWLEMQNAIKTHNFQQLPCLLWHERGSWSFSRWLSFAVVSTICLLVSQSLTQLTCSYETENQTRYLSCDLGNPMKSGTSVRTTSFASFCPFGFTPIQSNRWRPLGCVCSVFNSRNQSTRHHDFLLFIWKSCKSSPERVWTAQEKSVCVRKCCDRN